MKSSKSNSFAANSNGRICVTVINLDVSSSVSTTGVQGGITNTVVRNCAPVDGTNYGWSQWARSTLGVSTTNGTGLNNLYKYWVVTDRYNPAGSLPVNGLRGEAFSSTSFGTGNEIWGTTFFNTYGPNGTAQEMVVVAGSWK